MEPIEEFMSNYRDDITGLPIVNPVQLPCGHIMSMRMIEVLRAKENGFHCSKTILAQGRYEICEKSFAPDQVTKVSDTDLEDFVNRNQDAFGGDYKSVKSRSGASYNLEMARLQVVKASQVFKERHNLHLLPTRHNPVPQARSVNLTGQLLGVLLVMCVAWYYGYFERSQ